jgi:hypothetical protein
MLAVVAARSISPTCMTRSDAGTNGVPAMPLAICAAAVISSAHASRDGASGRRSSDSRRGSRTAMSVMTRPASG